MRSNYDHKDFDSICGYAKQLIGKTLQSACPESILKNAYSGKGRFGQLLEKYYFNYEPNSISGPDFPEAGLELKTTPLKRLKNGRYVAKERLVLNIINYMDMVEEAFTECSFWKKNANLLLVFYLYEKEKTALEYSVKLVDVWSFPSEDLAIIKKDWELIKSKVKNGKAHELSEGDTFYLGAATKGGKGGNPRKQPCSEVLAKQRAFSLKQGYVNHIIAKISGEESSGYGRLMKGPETVSLDDFVVAKFEPYYGKSITQIMGELGLDFSLSAKNSFARLTNAILGLQLDLKIQEFEKAEIIVKTVRLQGENSKPKESISFPNFKYMEIVEKEWADSDFKKILERKFFFVFYQYVGTGLVLRKVKFWNMPYRDIQMAKKVWEETVRRIKNGQASDLPKISESPIVHVRPHARNHEDTYETPTGEHLVKKCFWLNAQYIRDEIFMDKGLKLFYENPD